MLEIALMNNYPMKPARVRFGKWLCNCLALAILLAPGGFSSHAEEKPASPQPDPRLKWWEQARFAMFIHWGIYSVPAGEWNGKKGYGEWFQLETGMPADKYSRFAAQFDPVKFDAREWVSTAKSAGVKYIVITAKHHDGFAMFDSKASDWNIVKATPFGRDPLKELAAACEKQGIRLGFFACG